jgi:hypothetical protein
VPITTPTMQGALTTLERVKEELEISDSGSDSVLQRLINAASQAIATYTGRRFGFHRQSLTEFVPGYGSDKLMVSLTPVVEVDEIRFGEPDQPPSVVPAVDYVIDDPEAGFIRLLRSGWVWTGMKAQWIVSHRMPGTERPIFSVDYVGGWVTPKQAEDDIELERDLPYDLEDAAIMMISTRFGSLGERRDIVSERVMSASFTYSRGEFSPEVREILTRFRRVM